MVQCAQVADIIFERSSCGVGCFEIAIYRPKIIEDQTERETVIQLFQNKNGLDLALRKSYRVQFSTYCMMKGKCKINWNISLIPSIATKYEATMDERMPIFEEFPMIHL